MESNSPLPNIIARALSAVEGQRREDYGHPADDLGRTAGYWSIYLSAALGVPVELTAEQVCDLMVLLKMSRLSHKHTEDSEVDIMGYLVCKENIRKLKETMYACKQCRVGVCSAHRTIPGVDFQES